MSKNIKKRPKLSIVTIFHNMCREAERTLYTLSADYQEDVTIYDYEVIAIDNVGNTNTLETTFYRK